MNQGTKNEKKPIIISTISVLSNTEKFNRAPIVHVKPQRGKTKIHPNIKFIIILVTDEKKYLSNLFIFIIFPLSIKCRLLFTELLYLIYTYHIIYQYTTAANSHNIISKLYQALISD